MADAAAAGKSGKVVIRNVGLMLSGDIDRPILDADTIVVNDGIIVAVGLTLTLTALLSPPSTRSMANSDETSHSPRGHAPSSDGAGIQSPVGDHRPSNARAPSGAVAGLWMDVV